MHTNPKYSCLHVYLFFFLLLIISTNRLSYFEVCSNILRKPSCSALLPFRNVLLRCYCTLLLFLCHPHSQVWKNSKSCLNLHAEYAWNGLRRGHNVWYARPIFVQVNVETMIEDTYIALRFCTVIYYVI